MKAQTTATHAQNVRDRLEGDILAGYLLPGTRIDEEELAQRYGVSRTPIREAIVALAQAGLIVKRPRQGAVVAAVDPDELLQIFEVAGEINALCARLACRRISEADKRALAKHHAAAEQALLAGDAAAYDVAVTAFHYDIIRGSRNKVLIDVLRKLATPLTPFFHHHLQYPGQMHKDFAEHIEILAALQDADAERAGELVRRHVTVPTEILNDYLSLRRAV